MNGYCKILNVEEAMSLYRQIISKGVRQTVITYNTLLTGLFNLVKLVMLKNFLVR